MLPSAAVPRRRRHGRARRSARPVRHPGQSRGRRAAALAPRLLLLAALLVAAAGCARAHPLEDLDTRLTLTLEGPRRPLRPGEALVVRARLAHAGAEEVQVRGLSAGSLEFLLARGEAAEPVRRRPVASEREDLAALTRMAPQTAQERAFVVLRATEHPGRLHLQARYATPGAAGPDVAIYSPAVPLIVEGERALERAPNGLVTTAEAVRLAAAALGTPPAAASARLVRNEAGLLDYWVTLAAVPPAPPRAWFVNPYLGVVRAEARPDPLHGRPSPAAEPPLSPTLETTP